MAALYDQSFLILFLLIAIPISLIDIRSYRIPDRLVYPGIALSLLFTIILRPGLLCASITGGLISLLFLWGIRHFTNGLGMGDVKFGVFIGLYCGFPTIFPAFIFSSLTALLMIGMLIVIGKQRIKDPIPFGPFLTLGAIIAQLAKNWLTALV